MKTIKLAFKSQDLEKDSDLYKLFLQQGQGLKLWALYKSEHITDQHFVKNCLFLEDWNITSVTELSANIKNISGVVFAHSQKLAIRYWDYINPRIRKKIKLVFEEGSHIRQMVIK